MINTEHKGLNLSVDRHKDDTVLYVDLSGFGKREMSRVQELIKYREDVKLHNGKSVMLMLKGCNYNKYLRITTKGVDSYPGVDELLDWLSDLLYEDHEDVSADELIQVNKQCDHCVHAKICIDRLLPYTGNKCSNYCSKLHDQMITEMFGVHIQDEENR